MTSEEKMDKNNAKIDKVEQTHLYLILRGVHYDKTGKN